MRPAVWVRDGMIIRGMRNEGSGDVRRQMVRLCIERRGGGRLVGVVVGVCRVWCLIRFVGRAQAVWWRWGLGVRLWGLSCLGSMLILRGGGWVR